MNGVDSLWRVRPAGHLRRGVALVLDLALHALVAAVVGVIAYVVQTAGQSVPPNAAEGTAGFAVIPAWLVFSFVHRTAIQARFHATFGKWMTGLCVVRPEDGTWPNFGYLVKAWFRSAVAAVQSDTPEDGEDGMPAVVRRRSESFDTL
ncbi:RDD family protein [Rhodococcus wratislaviensis]|uniref:RDD family protein n=1 Tax=Rhodococcus wratislaviensis TaxID=44752 RepID=UPI000DD3ED11|nr:RDD family protein [Rhodococcus wratislaviensis]